MARRATSLTKGRAAAKKAAPAAASNPAPAKPARRGTKATPRDESPVETSVADAFFAGGNDPAPEAESPSASKARRGRKAKTDTMSADIVSEAEHTDETNAPIEAAPAPKPAASPRKTRRNREPEASAPPPIEVTDALFTADSEAAAAQWHADTGTVTFDWPSIEQVAASEGPNQPMAKLLLAARAEGARSRWPF